MTNLDHMAQGELYMKELVDYLTPCEHFDDMQIYKHKDKFMLLKEHEDHYEVVFVYNPRIEQRTKSYIRYVKPKRLK